MKLDTFVLLCVAGCLRRLVLAEPVTHDGQFKPDHVLRVSLARIPSACETREDVIVNGTSPGPAIRLLPGARTWIRVYNDIKDQNLTMHWHGLSQRLAPFADGTPAVSQWPVPPGHFFDYEIATELEDAGSYFYHSHVDMQALSCAGPLIVEDCGSSPYHYDDERILLFQDYFQKTDNEMIQGLLSTNFTWTGETRAVMLNGRGVALDHTSSQGPSGEANGFYGSRRFTKFDGANSTSASWHGTSQDDLIKLSNDCTLPVIDVEPGKTYRFRFIAAAGLSFTTLGIEGHSSLTIVQIDGSEYNAPVTVGYLQIGSGQRFDVLLQTKTLEQLAAEGNKPTYYLQFETRDRPETYRGYGVLRYTLDAKVPAAPLGPIMTFPEDASTWLEYTFQPLHPATNQAPTAEEVNRRIILEAEQKTDPATGRVVWELAHMSYTDTARDRQPPTLVDIYQRGQAAIPDYAAALANHGWDPATKLFPAKVDEVLEIVIQNTGSQYASVSGIVESHPFHAHGQHYYDIGSGPGRYDPVANEAKLASLGYRPVKRDTTMLFRHGAGQVAPGEPAGWRAWRMRMAHPGVWMIHCHILAHMITGMESIWVVGDAKQIMSIPMAVSESYLTYGGSVFGNSTHAPKVYHYFDDKNKCVAAKADGGNDATEKHSA